MPVSGSPEKPQGEYLLPRHPHTPTPESEWGHRGQVGAGKLEMAWGERKEKQGKKSGLLFISP